MKSHPTSSATLEALSREEIFTSDYKDALRRVAFNLSGNSKNKTANTHR